MKTLRRIIFASLVVVIPLGIMVLLSGCSINGRPMRFSPVSETGAKTPPSTSWFIEGKTTNGQAVSCSFVEFDERGDFLEFRQHLDCQEKIRKFATNGTLLTVMYCHGWKNSSQSGDVLAFNAFLAKLADSKEFRDKGIRVHGVFLGWRGNLFHPFINEQGANYLDTEKAFGGPIVDSQYHRRTYWTGMIPENLSYWNRKGGAEDKVSGLPMARSIFTYAAASKAYGAKLNNRVCVIGHSFGALMLEQSLGQAMTGELTMEWWDKLPGMNAAHKPSLPFDLVLFVNSAAPAIYAKEMRDFLAADRSARSLPANSSVPVIVSLTSTADRATGLVHPIGNLFARFQPSLRREYTNGIFGIKQTNGLYPMHRAIPQWKFYDKTPGHHPYLINHWIVPDSAPLPSDVSSPAIFSANLSTNVTDPNLFFTSASEHPAAAWRIATNSTETNIVTLDGMPPAMQDSNYWIISCGKELVKSHGDVWSTTTMEVYAALFRAVETQRKRSLSP